MGFERWLPVVGYEGIYEVSDAGRVRSLDRKDSRGRTRRGGLRSPGRQKSGHLTIGLCRDGKTESSQVHWLVLEAFVGPRPEGMFGCHWNDDPSDNRLNNLRWATRAENGADSVRNGTHHMARRTHCPQGHEYTAENTYRKPSGQRTCIACRMAYKASNREQIRAKGREYGRRKRAERPPAQPRTHCKNGHAYDEAGIYVTPSGSRVCLTCKRERARQHYLDNRDKYIQKAADWTRENRDRARELGRENQRRYRANKKVA